MMKLFFLFCFVFAANAQDQGSLKTSPGEFDPTYGGIFDTSQQVSSNKRPTPSKLPDEYIHIDDTQDEFDWRLSKGVFTENVGKNVIMSPLSAKLLLTLVAEAAGQDVPSKTRTELENVLPYNKSLPAAREYFQKILTSLRALSKDYKVNFGSKIYIDRDVNPNQKFTAEAESSYNAETQQLNFADSRNSAKLINDWVKSVTQNKIKDLVSEDSVSNAVVLLVNAIYFDGTWRYAFNKTSQRPFATSSGKRIPVTFMEHSRNFYYYNSKKLGARILRLPYNGDKYSMFVILPHETNGINEVVKKLNSRDLSAEVRNVEEIEVNVALPKFKFDSSANLNEVVKQIGIREIFENTATLSGLARGGASEGKLKVSNIIQKSGIIVDERGTTAWSATEIEIVNKFGGDPKEFIADHPFIFYIEDETTGAKLFTGKVENPTE